MGVLQCVMRLDTPEARAKVAERLLWMRKRKLHGLPYVEPERKTRQSRPQRVPAAKPTDSVAVRRLLALADKLERAKADGKKNLNVKRRKRSRTQKLKVLLTIQQP